MECRDGHKEQTRFFCETCKKDLCANCIIDHSGHQFVKQSPIIPLLKEQAKSLKDTINKKLEEIKAVNEDQGLPQNIQMESIDEEFERITKKIQAKKEAFKASCRDVYEKEMEEVKKEIESMSNSTLKLNKDAAEIDNYIEKLGKATSGQEDDLQKELKTIEDTISKDLTLDPKAILNKAAPSLAKVEFDPILYKETGHVTHHLGVTPKNVHNAVICFFGDKSKVLAYNISQAEWSLLSLGDNVESQISEFNYYNSAVTLPDGSVLITGGGLSKTVGQFFMYPSPKLIQKSPMNQSRKEHASVFVQGAVYVLGGYDGLTNNFLNSCERYDIGTDQWTTVSHMLTPKCAFGANVLANREIFTMGGYDGSHRVSSIERYDVETDKWSLLDVKLKRPLSNSACFAESQNSIVVLGGGYLAGFCLEVERLDLKTNEWKKLSEMGDGRDLRNKVAQLNGEVYAIGGNKCEGERYSIRTKEWKAIPSYKERIDDNLDSWSCALCYEVKYI